MKHILLLVMVFITSISYSQIIDNFSDGDFTSNPPWTGNQNVFKVNSSFQLQLDDTEENQSYLSTVNTMIANVEWQFWVRLSFSPSANNNARIYLASDSENLLEPLNGYFLQLGESGSGDAVELFRQDEYDVVSICRGSDGLLSSSFEVRLKVIHDSEGSWKIYVDDNGGENFILECEGHDNEHLSTSYSGILCSYTKSNSTKMYFDDVYIGQIVVDEEPPILEFVSAETDSTLLLEFDEAIDESTANVLNNFNVIGDIGNPKSASIVDNNAAHISLLFGSSFNSGNSYQIEVSGIRDLSGNEIIPVLKEFNFHKPQTHDIVFNEIMADPTPTVGLPEFEYLELYNRTDWDIDLLGWKLIIGSSEKEFENYILKSKNYLIVAKESANEELAEYGSFYGFESFSLTNSGQSLELIDDDATIISTVTYAKSWYHQADKSEGGWSIEQQNPDNLCSGSENWSASIDKNGGTPGVVNSVFNDEVLLPSIQSYIVVDDHTLELFFNQSMDEESLATNANYLLSHDIGTPQYVYTYYDEPNKVELYFEHGYYKGMSYELTISSSIINCLGLEMLSDTNIIIGIPEDVQYNDIVINEILFNPLTDGEDFLEIYNRSEKIIDISNLKIGSVKINPPNPPDTNMVYLTQNQKLILPNDYLALTPSQEAVKDHYYTSNPNGFMNVYPFPSYTNSQGHAIIISLNGDLIDSFSYSESMHFPLLIFNDGVSLERINPDVSISDNSNWHSASESVGFGTPAYQNSQYLSNKLDAQEISIEPEIFSPDNDGRDDIINILYNFNKVGFLISITVYNADGYQVRSLVNNSYIGTQGSFSWDGIKDDNSKAPIGIYIFYIVVVDIDGKIKKYKRTGVLASYL